MSEQLVQRGPSCRFARRRSPEHTWMVVPGQAHMTCTRCGVRVESWEPGYAMLADMARVAGASKGVM